MGHVKPSAQNDEYRSSETMIAELVRRHQRTVLGICKSILSDDHLAEDAAQESFGRLFRRLKDGPLDNPGGWLRRAATSAAIDLLRRRPVPFVSNALEESAASSTDPGHKLDVETLKRRLYAAVQELPEAQRIIFLLRHDSGMSLREVAGQLDLEASTVKTHFARACWKLSSILRNYDPKRVEP